LRLDLLATGHLYPKEKGGLRELARRYFEADAKLTDKIIKLKRFYRKKHA